jgi:tocopherol O-methyltransferase
MSGAQVKLATARARKRGLESQVEFRVADANDERVFPNDMDVIWVIECSEHLADKRRFIQTCFDRLKPGGILALCAWVDRSKNQGDRNLISEICDRMLCPSLGRWEHYHEWIRTSGFQEILQERDLSLSVKKTWSVCCSLLDRWDVKTLVRVMGGSTRRFADSFSMMKQAFDQKAMGYGLFAARKT